MAVIVKREWIDNEGHYEFDRGYEGLIVVKAEEHKIWKGTNVYASVNFPDLYNEGLLPGGSFRSKSVKGPIKTQEEGKRIGEGLLLAIITEVESEVASKTPSKIQTN